MDVEEGSSITDELTSQVNKLEDDNANLTSQVVELVNDNLNLTSWVMDLKNGNLTFRVEELKNDNKEFKNKHGN